MVGPTRPQFVLFGSSIVQKSFDNGGWGAILADTYARKVFLRYIYIYPSFSCPSLMILVSFSVSKHSSRFQTLVLLCFCESENGGGHFHDSVLIFCFDIYMVMIKKRQKTLDEPTALTRSLKHASKGV